MVDVRKHREHLRCWGLASREPMDVPQIPSHLWCFGHLGSNRARKAIRARRNVPKPGLVISHRSVLASSGMDTKQNLSRQEMDSSDQHTRHLLWVCRNATSHSNEYRKLDYYRDNLQLLCFQVSEDVVAEIQLCSVCCIGRWNGFHGSSVVLCSAERGQEREVVGIGARSLPVGFLPYSTRDCGSRLSSFHMKMVFVTCSFD